GGLGPGGVAGTVGAAVVVLGVLSEQGKDEGGDSGDSGSSASSTPPTGSVLAAVDADGMVHLSGGTFQMGSTTGDSDETPVHSVTLSSFYISEAEVTAGEYKACVDAGGCTAAGSGSYATYKVSGQENNPINYVSWDDAQSYITWLNQSSSRSYRLCSEAEWEYAARAGTTTAWSCGDSESCLSNVAWYSANNSPDGTKAVKTKTANAWGLYDMHGNVWEWVNDWYGSYSSGSVTNPTGPASGSNRVGRGGGFGDDGGLRSADRNYDSPGGRYSILGFRLCSSL
ncbi:formylglycine-generating enzyme family protein, partial [Deltaproteobacteria bacterium TL4]